MSTVSSRCLLLTVIKVRGSESPSQTVAQSTSAVFSVAYAAFYGVKLLALPPTLKPGGPRNCSLSGLYQGVQDSRQHNSRGHGDTQAAPPRQGEDPTDRGKELARNKRK